MNKHHIQHLYIRISDDRYHVLKNILEGYDNMGIVSSQAGNSDVVLLRYPYGVEKDIFELLAHLSSILKNY